MKRLGLLALICLTACSGAGPAGDYRPYLAKKKIYDITPENIPHCHGYGCRLRSQAFLTNTEWKQISGHFKANKNAEQERIAISKAIGQFEKTIGKKLGTDQDVAGTYDQLGNEQEDCVDESVNATIYLDLLSQKGWLKYHDISNIAARIPLLGGGGGFHQTAVIVERATGTRYAVDSWFHDNGHNAEVVKLDDWLYGWRPD